MAVKSLVRKNKITALQEQSTKTRYFLSAQNGWYLAEECLWMCVCLNFVKTHCLSGSDKSIELLRYIYTH